METIVSPVPFEGRGASRVQPIVWVLDEPGIAEGHLAGVGTLVAQWQESGRDWTLARVPTTTGWETILWSRPSLETMLSLPCLRRRGRYGS